VVALECDGLFSDGLDVTAIYTPQDGDGVEIQIVFSMGEYVNRADSIITQGGVHILPVERSSRPHFHGGRARQIATAFVRESDIETPEYMDTIEVDGVTWTVKEVYDHA
jgi:hypothetical protein